MKKLDGRKAVLHLIKAYEEEDRLYEDIERAALEQCDVLRDGRDPARLREIVDRQRDLSEQIGKIEAGIAPLREHWELMRDSLADPEIRTLAEVLDALLERLIDRIHTIVEVERTNSEELLAPTSRRSG